MAAASNGVDARLDSLERFAIQSEHQLSSVKESLAGLGTTVNAQSSKIDHIANAVTAWKAAEDATPKESLFKRLQFIALAVGLLGGAATAVTYIASNINAADNRELKVRLEFMTQRLDNGWFADRRITIRTKGDTE